MTERTSWAILWSLIITVEGIITFAIFDAIHLIQHHAHIL